MLTIAGETVVRELFGLFWIVFYCTIFFGDQKVLNGQQRKINNEKTKKTGRFINVRISSLRIQI